MNTIQKTAVAVITFGALALAPLASAREAGNGVAMSGDVRVGASTTVEMGARASSTMRENDDDGDDAATSSARRGENEGSASRGVATSSATRGEGEAHRSAVADIVRKLLLDADRDGGIGAEVRAIASLQASSSENSAKAMDTLGNEGGFKKFLLGPDFKSLGDLRSTMMTTQNSIERLTRARDRATSASVRADLDVQITALKGVASSTDAFVKSHQGGFSLFGWLVRLIGS